MDERRRGGPNTVELDRDELEKLARETAKQPEDPAETLRALAAGTEPPTSRTATLHDPLTMALLAEVARSSQTIEIDPEAAARAEARAREGAHEDAAPHPHVKRRGS